ncbi:MAG: glycoside hydrolase family 13 domain protein [Gemmatimonadetes bacterium]|nr:glycoside hydrolase family 13 domain protein [Gemmatimonadota bacterium]
MRRIGGFIGMMTFIMTCVTCVICASPIGAQQVATRVSIAGGSATDVAGVTSRAVTISPSLSVAPGPRLLLGADASATRYDNRQWSVGGGATLAARAPLAKSVALTLNGGASATGTSYDFSYTTASALPAIELSGGPVSGYAGVEAAVASTRTVRVVPSQPGLFGAPSPSPASRTTLGVARSARGAVFGGNLRLLGADGETAIVGVREEHATVDTIPTVDRSLSLSVANGSVTVGGSAGVRAEPGSHSAFGSGALAVAVGPALALTVAAGSYPANHLIGTPAGRFFNLGMSIRTGRVSPSEPKIDGVPAVAAGMTRLALRDDAAASVEVAGDFTNWKPIAARRATNGVWFVDLAIPPGQYRYAFRVNGRDWKVPDGSAAVDDDFGGKTAWLTVSGPPNRSVR